MSPQVLSLLLLIALQECVQAEYRASRFLFPTQTSATPTIFCTSYCPIRCVAGYVRSPYGCYYCQCASGVISGVGGSHSAATSNMLSINGQVYLTHPCHPAFRFCGMKCYYGLLTGVNGCQYCACASPPKAQATPTIPVPYAVPTIPIHRHDIFTTRIAITIRPTTTTTTTTTTRQTTTTTRAPPTTVSGSISPTNGGYVDPCIPSQKCGKNCSGEFVLGPEDCQYCICEPHSLHQNGTTTSATIYHTTDAAPTTLDPAVLSETCSIARAICRLNCPHGVQAIQDDCRHCKCLGHTAADTSILDTPSILGRNLYKQTTHAP